jgi:osmoprotectant transport system permease protein
MNLLAQSYNYVVSHREQMLTALGQHLFLVAIPLVIGLLIGLPLGLFSARSPWAAGFLTQSVNSLRVIPSLAVLFVMIPYTGLTPQSAIIALTLLVLPPILMSTDVGFRTIEPAILEAAQGMGMTTQQILWMVEIPLALPVILAGIKTATVEAIASATLAAFIGAGGLGTLITLGFALYDQSILLAGAIPIALLALLAELSLGGLEKLARPRP